MDEESYYLNSHSKTELSGPVTDEGIAHFVRVVTQKKSLIQNSAAGINNDDDRLLGSSFIDTFRGFFVSFKRNLFHVVAVDLSDIQPHICSIGDDIQTFLIKFTERETQKTVKFWVHNTGGDSLRLRCPYMEFDSQVCKIGDAALTHIREYMPGLDESLVDLDEILVWIGPLKLAQIHFDKIEPSSELNLAI